MIKENLSLPGIVRLSFDKLYKDKSIENKINYYLRNLKGVKSVNANSITGKILIKFEDITVDDLKKGIIESVFKDDVNDSMKRYEPEHLPLRMQFSLTLLSFTALIYVWIRQLFLGKSPLSIHYGLLSISSIISIIAGYPIFRSGLNTLLNEKKINGDLMITIATLMTLILRESILGLFVVFLVNLSIFMHTITIHYNKRALKEFMKLKPGKVWLNVEGKDIEIPIEELNNGDIISLRKNDIVPFDSTIISGEAQIDERYVTGKTEYIKKYKGDNVKASSMIIEGEIKAKIDNIEDTEEIEDLEEITELESKEKFTTSISDIYIKQFIPISFFITGIVSLLTNDILKGISSMLVLCPCTFSHGMSGVYSMAIRNASRKGVLIKSSKSIHNLSNADKLIFDKTGTLTEGRPIVSNIYPIGEYNEKKLIKIAASIENGIIHPVALSIMKKASQEGTNLLPSFDNKEIENIGASAYVEGKPSIIGNSRFMSMNNINLNDVKYLSLRLKHLNETAVFVAVDGKIIGIIGIKDIIKTSSQIAIDEIRSYGVDEISLVSGDDEEPTKKIACELGIDEMYSNVSENDKEKLIIKNKKDGKTVIMVGDGINDIKALKTADVGILLGRPINKKLLQALDVAIIDENPIKVSEIMGLSIFSKDIVRQNHIIASTLGYVEYMLTLLGKVNPFMAAILHNVNQLVILANSFKVYKYHTRRNLYNGRGKEKV